MHKVTCKQCGKETKKYSRDGTVFCNRNCYMDWKRINPNKKPYKGRVFISGYWYLYKPKHPNAIKKGRYIAEHRFVLEQKIGRYLKSNEIAHHKNGDKTDNSPTNLELLTINEHNSHHAKSRKRKSNGKF